MLQREQATAKASDSENDDETNLHPLYRRITNADAQIIYYHKHYGMFCTEGMPRRAVSYPGGILADEMGLGKTLEVLAMILINQRKVPVSHAKIEPLLKSLCSKTFKCMCGQPPSRFSNRSVGSAQDSARDQQNDQDIERRYGPLYSCIRCESLSHLKCLNYRGKNIYNTIFIVRT
jgi:hypothetical protein